MERDAPIFVAGTENFIGKALARVLLGQGFSNLLSHDEALDFSEARAVDAFFAKAKPRYVFVSGARFGGIGLNQLAPADLMRDNLLLATHVIESARRHGVERLLYLASSCVYPRSCPQPMRVESLMSGPLEPTSSSYALANLAGIALCRAYRLQYGANFIPAIKADAFGPDDEFDEGASHVVPGLIRRMHQAKVRGEPSVVVWGSGKPRRDLIWADDVADACLLVMRSYRGAEPINIGGGTDLSIAELAELIREVVGYEGELVYDTAKPDGAPQKLLDSTALFELGWRPKTAFREALALMYDAFLRREETPEQSGETGSIAALNRHTAYGT